MAAGIARAQFGELPLRARATLGGAGMVSDDQRSWLGYQSLGLVAEMQLGYGWTPWLDLRLGVSGGGFPAEDGTGGLLAPALGAAIGWPNASIRPWFGLDIAAGFTGSLLRPMWRASMGADFRVSNAFTLGPVVGYTQLFQHSGPGASTDARFVWFGFALGLSAVAKQPVSVHERWVTRRRRVDRVTDIPAEPAPAPPAEPPRDALNPQLMTLLDDAMPAQSTQRHEWLAPILFQVDSAELEPQGVAMLHEVARELSRRPELPMLEIEGYADSRGSLPYNLELSERRARAVLEWLVAHGVARERLRVRARGASDFVEPGSTEAEHEQNRRVVFRVVDTAEQP